MPLLFLAIGGIDMNKLKVLNGIDNIEKYIDLFKGKKLGLVTTPTGVNKNFESTIDVLYKNFNLKYLYSPEHGIRGNLQAGATVGTYIDEKTGLTVYSLYGENKKPSKDMIEDIDAMVFDMQDIGSRYYTFIYTMAYCMEACAENNKEFIVLDRINPLGGEVVEGNILKSEYSSFVGLYPIPVRYGLTSGELALYINKEFNINCDLEVVKVQGWSREQYADDTDLLWINPSPNMPSIESALIYNGTCLFEGTNLSEGRGTTKPFEFIGAPFVDGEKLCKYMEDLKLPGVKFRPIYFVPTFSKNVGELCEGVQVHVTDKRQYRSVDVGIYMLHYIANTYKDKFQWITSEDFNNRHFIDLLAGTDEIRTTDFNPKDLLEKWHKESEEFKNKKKAYHIYK